MKYDFERTKESGRAIRRRSIFGNKKSPGGRAFFAACLIVLAAAGWIFLSDRIPSQEMYNRISTTHIESGEVAVTFLDVGQGEAIVVYTLSNAVLIDGGDHARRAVVQDYLTDAGIERLCYVIITHPHSDHIGGLVTVLSRMDVGHVVMPEITHNTATFENLLIAIESNDIPVTFPEIGHVIAAGEIIITVISPPASYARGINDSGIVARLDFSEVSFLFTGDAEARLEQMLVSSDSPLNATVLSVGHHGSRTSTTQTFLDAVDPVIAVISAGYNNQFGHPHREVTDRLSDGGVAIMRTDKMGTIRLVSDGRRIFVVE